MVVDRARNCALSQNHIHQTKGEVQPPRGMRCEKRCCRGKKRALQYASFIRLIPLPPQLVALPRQDNSSQQPGPARERRTNLPAQTLPARGSRPLAGEAWLHRGGFSLSAEACSSSAEPVLRNRSWASGELRQPHQTGCHGDDAIQRYDLQVTNFFLLLNYRHPFTGTVWIKV